MERHIRAEVLDFHVVKPSSGTSLLRICARALYSEGNLIVNDISMSVRAVI
jgi:hypothetical protein